MKNRNLPVISIVIPCYNEDCVLPQSLRAIGEILDELKNRGEVSPESFIMCVDDGSTDRTWEILRESNSINPAVKGISLAGNRGHQFALLAGLMTVKDLCDAAISIDADLQDDPRAILEMVRLFREGYDIVYGVRKSREKDSWFKRNSARLFYRIQRGLGIKVVYDHADYRLMSAEALDILSEYGEQNLYLRGIIPQIGLKSATVYYSRGHRAAGESKYPLGKMLSFSVDGITSFTARPMKWIFVLGLLLIIVDIAVAAYVLAAFFNGRTVDGWTSIMLSLWFIGGLLFMVLGIIGEYIGKIFMETKNRPRFHVREKIE